MSGQLHPKILELNGAVPPPLTSFPAFLRYLRRMQLHELGAVIAGGLYALSIEKMMIDTLGQTIEAETHKELMVTDTEAPNFDTHDFRDDILAEVAGAGYTAGGVACTGTEVTIAAGLMTFDMVDTVYPTVTITDAMAGVFYTNVGTAATDQLIVLQDFVTAASSTAADFTIQHAGGGVFTLDHTP